ncbi:uncharacterized protein PV07_06977 [Cladophialophora immunda]|uniref:Uncharacterized protein n=1 Tax=Cladophialophora immunda TaxID=569365 RepID=A0A0D2C7T3_9EURO|nr:uncharacterized protein PV07_06977 [Cladophialophora immunda]KIW27218.1 hypothetical protein PV07_06977 [Cladophialophora immunda]
MVEFEVGRWEESSARVVFPEGVEGVVSGCNEELHRGRDGQDCMKGQQPFDGNREDLRAQETWLRREMRLFRQRTPAHLCSTSRWDELIGRWSKSVGWRMAQQWYWRRSRGLG